MTTPARPTPKVNVAALVTEIVEEARKNAQPPAPSKSRVIPSYVAAGLVFALCAWAWVAPPAWLVPQPVAAPKIGVPPGCQGLGFEREGGKVAQLVRARHS